MKGNGGRGNGLVGTCGVPTASPPQHGATYSRVLYVTKCSKGAVPDIKVDS